MRYLKLTVAYDGTAYHGWAVQPAVRGPTVQGVMQERLGELTGECLSLVAASRTDAGVHARGQVVVFSTRSRIPLDRWPLAANSVLPPDIAVLKAEEVPPGFDPRKHALYKTYSYTIHNHPLPDVFRRRYVLEVRAPLAVDAMQEAAGYLVGRHDFRAFCASGGAARTTVRTLYRCRVRRWGPRIRVEATADGFLYHMVRIIVGTLLEVGLGRLEPEQVAAIMAEGRREAAGPTAPARGLCLERVVFRNPGLTDAAGGS
ncbi:MAG: tRNA pseudouridine(38-40) synthase TruA [Clostridia bacterium]|jgi:tRNA pseudouridine38-40 synthase|nr:tRNA pseudouridine(38-40) synthase TruA [Clostridia bacterium]MDH7571960.1 tRNA pseudouridine(38-40) synthase TruA [Clostridia bacterium]